MHQMAQLQQAVECSKAASEGAAVNQDKVGLTWLVQSFPIGRLALYVNVGIFKAFLTNLT